MKPWQNSEGYNDPTAYSAIKAENAREADLARLRRNAEELTKEIAGHENER